MNKFEYIYVRSHFSISVMSSIQKYLPVLIPFSSSESEEFGVSVILEAVCKSVKSNHIHVLMGLSVSLL